MTSLSSLPLRSSALASLDPGQKVQLAKLNLANWGSGNAATGTLLEKWKRLTINSFPLNLFFLCWRPNQRLWCQKKVLFSVRVHSGLDFYTACIFLYSIYCISIFAYSMVLVRYVLHLAIGGQSQRPPKVRQLLTLELENLLRLSSYSEDDGHWGMCCILWSGSHARGLHR